MTQAFPLQWPISRPRTKSPTRATFGKKVQRSGQSWSQMESLTVAEALRRLQREIDLLGARDYILSSNLQVRLDGLPRSGQAEPADRGVALYFTLSGKPHCLPCDRYDRVADNIAAIAKHIEATRAIERYGVASLAEMFTGFAALSAPAKRTWRDVLGIGPGVAPVTASIIEDQFRRLAKKCHPDAGGSNELMAELNAARAAALKEIGGFNG